MSMEDKIFEAAEEVDDGFLECYIRFNDDSEKDYCFQVKVKSEFNDLYKIFSTLPISLRPSVFYSSKPLGFKISTSPGYLTDDGALLFDDDATNEKYLKSVDLHDKIGDKIWPGQLIVPIWEHNDFHFYSFITFLLVWLYTDLPDCISPTPGICLTNQMSKLLRFILEQVGNPALGKSFVDDLEEPLGVVPQLIFFVFHIVKVSVIFLFIHLGIFNPIKVIKFVGPPSRREVTRDELLELGWTGSKRATVEEYKEYFRSTKLKSYKSMIEAHQEGAFEKLKQVGVDLKEGEGFNTPLDHKSTLEDLLNKEDVKFTLNYAYLARLSALFEKHINEPDVDVNEAVKQFRRYGLFKRDKVIEEIVELRKSIDKPIEQ